jgi:hypothetical protein
MMGDEKTCPPVIYANEIVLGSEKAWGIASVE